MKLECKAPMAQDFKILDSRYVKGSPFGTEQTPVATTGVGTLDLEEVDADTSEAPESPEQVAKTAEAFPSFRERFVGAGYKQVKILMRDLLPHSSSNFFALYFMQ